MTVKTPQEWTLQVGEKLGCVEEKDGQKTVSLNGIATKLNKEGVSQQSIMDFLSTFTGIVILGKDANTVKEIVRKNGPRGERKSYSTSGVQTALKEAGVPEELLLPAGKRGRSSTPVVVNNEAIMSLFESSATGEENQADA